MLKGCLATAMKSWTLGAGIGTEGGMVLGLSIGAFTTLHVVISLIAFAAPGYLAMRRFRPVPVAA